MCLTGMIKSQTQAITTLENIGCWLGQERLHWLGRMHAYILLY